MLAQYLYPQHGSVITTTSKMIFPRPSTVTTWSTAALVVMRNSADDEPCDFLFLNSKPRLSQTAVFDIVSRGCVFFSLSPSQAAAANPKFLSYYCRVTVSRNQLMQQWLYGSSSAVDFLVPTLKRSITLKWAIQEYCLVIFFHPQIYFHLPLWKLGPRGNRKTAIL